MAVRRLTGERLARLVAAVTALGLPLALVAQRVLPRGGNNAVEIHARMPDKGGWTPTELTAVVGQPLHLRLTSDDVVHSFAIGRTDVAPIELEPGALIDTTVTFDAPGRYTFYCTRWCGPNHWRMRGTIVVRGPDTARGTTPAALPLYQTLGLDLDAPHTAATVPARAPNPTLGAAHADMLPDSIRGRLYYRTHSPADAWAALRTDPGSRRLTDGDLWDLVAFQWSSRAGPGELEEGRSLYRTNCAACHGELGRGDGVMADRVARDTTMEHGPGSLGPADFTDASSMLGANSVILQGKILRGGMGTGMPNWGGVFTERQTWALVAYLWQLQFGSRAASGPDTFPR